MAGITEAKVYEALGITPRGEGAKAQEVTDPAAQVSTFAAEEGAREQEVTDPADAATPTEPGQDPEAGAASAQSEEPAEGAGQQPGMVNQTQSQDERRANAARRRQQEQQAAIDAAVAAARAEEQKKYNDQMQAFFQNANLKDTFSGKAITNIDEFNAWFAKHREGQLATALQSGKMTPELLQQAISEHPAVKQAAAAAQQLQQANDAAIREREQAQINAEMQQIMELDKSIKGVADLLTMPGAAEFKEKVGKGYSFVDAFLLVRGPELEAARDEAARQAAINNARGKEHLGATGSSRGAGAVSVPQEQMKMYRLFNPSMTDAQIQAHYNKTLKQRGGN